MSKSPALKCPSCGSNLQLQDFDLANNVVKCSYCAALMPLGEHNQRQERDAGSKPQVALPHRMTMQETPGGIEIRRRWFTPLAIFLVFFCLSWNGFLVGWYSIAFKGHTPLAMKLFPIVHVAVGVFLTYYTLALFVNTTRVAVDRGQLRVAHGPLPWAGNKTMRVEEVDQLFCKETIKRTKNGIHTRYEVWIALKSGLVTKLLADLEARDQALFIEQQLERHLNIRDRYVPGEFMG